MSSNFNIINNIQIFKNPNKDFLKSDLISMLKAVNKPFWIFLTGQDESRSRVIATLLHGNESSGIKASYKLLNYYLNNNIKPAVNICFFIGATSSAILEPYFSNRYVENGIDFNRCFRKNYNNLIISNLSDKHKKYINYTKSFVEFIKILQPEAILDIHNTTSPGEAFGVSIKDTLYHRRLINFFSNKLVISNIRLGSLMELDINNIPIVTIECGGANDINSQKVAYFGIEQYCENQDLWLNLDKSISNLNKLDYIKDINNFKIYKNPIRLEYISTGQISFSDTPDSNSDLTILNSFSNNNFSDLKKGQVFAYINNLNKLRAYTDNPEQNYINEYFTLDKNNNVLIVKQDITVFMLTDNPNISKNDCICYFTGIDN